MFSYPRHPEALRGGCCLQRLVRRCVHIFKHLWSLHWECTRQTRQIHENKSVARLLYFRPPSSTGANGGNRGSSLSPLPLLPPVQKSRRHSLTPNDELSHRKENHEQ